MTSAPAVHQELCSPAAQLSRASTAHRSTLTQSRTFPTAQGTGPPCACRATISALPASAAAAAPSPAGAPCPALPSPARSSDSPAACSGAKAKSCGRSTVLMTAAAVAPRFLMQPAAAEHTPRSTSQATAVTAARPPSREASSAVARDSCGQTVGRYVFSMMWGLGGMAACTNGHAPASPSPCLHGSCTRAPVRRCRLPPAAPAPTHASCIEALG